MSENQWMEIMVPALHTVRLVCQHPIYAGTEKNICGASIQIPLDKLAAVKKCPMCDNLLHPVADKHEDPFQQLISALNGLQRISEVKISFVLPAKD